jgi:hypothetical protein
MLDPWALYGEYFTSIAGSGLQIFLLRQGQTDAPAFAFSLRISIRISSLRAKAELHGCWSEQVFKLRLQKPANPRKFKVSHA